MKAKISTIFAAGFAVSLGFSGSAIAQVDTHTDNHQITVVVPTVALLDLESDTPDNLTATFVAPTEAGEKIAAPEAISTIWLNYSSIQNGQKTKRVDVETSALVPGVDIRIQAGASGTGVGTLGQAELPFNLTVLPKKLIDGIGSAYTTSGPSKGHPLTYSFLAEDGNYADIRSGSPLVTVKYTLVEN